MTFKSQKLFRTLNKIAQKTQNYIINTLYKKIYRINQKLIL